MSERSSRPLHRQLSRPPPFLRRMGKNYSTFLKTPKANRLGFWQMISSSFFRGCITSKLSTAQANCIFIYLPPLSFLRDRPLGKIKYLKDGATDADLDPEMSVYDAFVDAGKAATSPEDQVATIKIIREVRGQHFSIREGSVVPDLSKPRFRPRNPPPVPPFSDTVQSLGKRSRDDAFRAEASNREGSHGSGSTRRRRLHTPRESGEADRPVPSIERELRQKPRGPNHRQIRQESPMVIPETQETPLRHNPYPQQDRQDGSEILGGEEPKSESPEVENSIHSLPLADRDDDDIEILGTAPPAENGVMGAKILQHGQIRSQSAATEEPTSPSPSNYYSPPSGSLQARSNIRISGDELAINSADTIGLLCRPDPKASLSRTKLNPAKERLTSNGPITPITYASWDLQSKLTAKEASHRASNGVEPPSRTSSFSYKFRREDRLESVESEIDDTQMSPRSRRTLKRPRDARHSGTGLRSESVKLAGHSHQVDERRDLVQQDKRQRKVSNWGSRKYVQGVSEIDDGFHSREHAQNQDEQHRLTGSNSSESEDTEDMSAQRSKSHPRSNTTNKGSNVSNASTERPTTYTSLNALTISQTPQPQAMDEGRNTNALVENDSDKENAAHEQVMYHPPSTLDQRQDVYIAAQERSRASRKRHFNDDNEAAEIGKSIDDAVIGVLNQVSAASDGPIKSNMRSSQAQPVEILERLQSSSNQPSHISPNKSRKKKKSRLEGDETPKPDSQQMKNQFDNKEMTGNTFAAANHGASASKGQLKPGDITILLSEPDEQLSQDLQASAQAGDSKPAFLAKMGKGSDRKQYSWLRTSAGESSSKSQQEQADSDRKVSIVDEKQVQSKEMAKKRGSSDINVDVAPANHVPVESVDPEKGEDGKLGLGFSQSPPSKNIAFLPSSVNRDRLLDKSQNGISESLPYEQAKVSFLTKSKSFDKILSSQSLGIDTPSRSTQLGENVDSEGEQDMNVPGGKSETHGARAEVIGGVPEKTIASSSASDSASVSDDEASSVQDERTLNNTEPSVKYGRNGQSVDAAVPSVEHASDSLTSESSAAMRPPKTAIKVIGPSKNRPIVIPLGNNSYSVDGKCVVVPPGLTVDAYLALRSGFVTKLEQAEANAQNRQGSTATPVPVTVEVAPKKALSTSNKPRANAKKAKESWRPSPAPPLAKTSAKPTHKVSKTTDPPRPTIKASQATQVPAAPQIQPATNPSSSANPRPAKPMSTSSNIIAAPSAKPTSTSSKPIAAPPAKPKSTSSRTVTASPAQPNGLSHHPAPPTNPTHLRAAPAKAPSNLKEFKAQRAADNARTLRASASSSKLPSVTNSNNNPLLHHNKTLQGGAESDDDDDDDESESETESETKSSSKMVVAKQGKGVAGKMKNPVLVPTIAMATGAAAVDLSIRDQSPSSDEDE
jgi:hypothetical protein